MLFTNKIYENKIIKNRKICILDKNWNMQIFINIIIYNGYQFCKSTLSRSSRRYEWNAATATATIIYWPVSGPWSSIHCVCWTANTQPEPRPRAGNHYEWWTAATIQPGPRPRAGNHCDCWTAATISRMPAHSMANQKCLYPCLYAMFQLFQDRYKNQVFCNVYIHMFSNILHWVFCNPNNCRWHTQQIPYKLVKTGLGFYKWILMLNSFMFY